MKFKRLMLEQLDEQLKIWSAAKRQPTPKKGWINLIRLAVGLSSYRLAKRMGVNQARVIQIESAECNENIKLKTLKESS